MHFTGKGLACAGLRCTSSRGKVSHDSSAALHALRNKRSHPRQTHSQTNTQHTQHATAPRRTLGTSRRASFSTVGTMSLRRPRTIAALLPPRDADAPALGAGAPARANSWSDAAPASGATRSRYRLASLSGGARVPSIDLTSLSNNGVLDMGLMDSSSSDDEASSHDGRSVLAMSSGSFGSHGSASSAAAATPGEGVPTTSPSSAAAASLGAPAERPASAPRHRRATRGSSGKHFGGGAAAAASVDVSPDGWQAPADGDVDDAPELQALVSRLVRVRPHVPAVDGAAVNATTTGGGEVAFDERGRVCVRFPYRNPIVVPGNHNISPALDNEAVYTRYLNR